MSLNELMPELHNLDRADKLRVMQFLVQELAQEESRLLDAGSYPVWSPYDSFEAGNILLEALKTDDQRV